MVFLCFQGEGLIMKKLTSGIILFCSLTLSNVMGANSSFIPNFVEESVDLVELNHFHDCLGRHVYDQVIFYEWCPARSLYLVRAWCLVEERDLVNRIPVKNYANDTYIVHWQDRDENLLREITATHYRESWTQIDPERANKKIHDEKLRVSLIKRMKPKSRAELESDLEGQLAEENNETPEELRIPVLLFQLN
jgi:hypothetical protein